VFHNRRPVGRPRGRRARALATAALSLTLLGAAGCGFEAQTLQPYTPADGTNLDVGADNQLKIRNLVVVSKTDGQGIISASILSGADDQLTGAAVVPSPLSGSPGPAVTAKVAAPIALPGGRLVVLTNQPLITVSSPQLVAGGAASVTLQFAGSGEVALNCPVVDGNLPEWSSIGSSASPSPSTGLSITPSAEPQTPIPSPSASGSASPAPSPSPSATG
jgi:hypothetical protein